MRGADERTAGLFSYVSCEARVPSDHPLRPIRMIVDEALEVLSADFEQLYSKTGRPSIPPEKLLRALLLQAFYSIRSERQLMEQLDYNLLFRWFVGLAMDAPVWDPSVFTKNRDRLLDGDVAAKFLNAVLGQERVKALLSDDHFSVDGTLIEAWASIKSFRPKDGSDDPPGPGRNAERDFHKEKRSNETHQSTTDPEAKLYRKGRWPGGEAVLHGPCADGERRAQRRTRRSHTCGGTECDRRSSHSSLREGSLPPHGPGRKAARCAKRIEPGREVTRRLISSMSFQHFSEIT